jgi:Fe-S cluster assembly protein SufD
MISAAQQRDWLQQLTATPEVAANHPQWIENMRAAAREKLSILPLVDRSAEAWRYTSVESLLKQSFKSSLRLPDALPNLDALQVMESYRVVLVNGHYAASLSSAELPAGVSFGSLRDAWHANPDMLANRLLKNNDHAEHIFSALNTALMQDGVWLHVAAGVELDRPLEIIYFSQTDSQPLLIQPRNLILLAAGAKATLVERFISGEPSVYFHNNLTDIVLADDAVLEHYRIQDESRNAYHLSSLHLSLHARSHYHATSLALGGAWARTDYITQFQHAGAECELNGLYTVGNQQLIDFHLDVRHQVPGCASRAQFKGLLYGKGRAVFDGRILVEKNAQHTDARLSNDNLLLTRDAEVDTKPQLKIYADDVQCSHGTTVGQLDAQQIFYMRSRGIDAATARNMLCLGFANTVLDNIQLPALREYASQKLGDTLQAVAAMSGENDGSKTDFISRPD